MKTLRTQMILLALLVCVGCSGNHSPMLPTQLEGVWRTDDPRYQDRFLELSPTFVILVTGRSDRASVQWIDKVEIETLGEATAFTVYSTDYLEGTHHEMALQFTLANGGELPFKNQSQVWKRRADFTE
jgi:hypothetical protein